MNNSNPMMMGAQIWKRDALSDLHQILFRPGAATFAPKPFVKHKSLKQGEKFSKIHSRLYSPIAKSFLQEKEPPQLAKTYCNYVKKSIQSGNGNSTTTISSSYEHHGVGDMDKSFQKRHQPKYRLSQAKQSNMCNGLHATAVVTPINPKRKEELALVTPINPTKKGESGSIALITPTRRGELRREIMKTIWGPTPRKKLGHDEKQEVEAHELILKLRKRKGEVDNKAVECLMDVLLRNWVYFEHSHAATKTIGNHVHAKYCEGAFGHYLLRDGTQIHGSYVISLRELFTQLKSLMAKLKAKITHSTYKEVPSWKPPRLEEVVEFCSPQQKPMPQLYPIEGLLPLPKDDIPADFDIPLLRTPKLQQHPPYTRPKFARKVAVLDIPSPIDFAMEEKSIEPYKEIPAPIFKMPELLPLPIWQEPQKEPLPPIPINKEAKILQPMEREVIPPYETPQIEARPCEASYYSIEPGETFICDGLCGRSKGRERPGDPPQSACLARRPKTLVIPRAPINEGIPDPSFQPPTLESLPPFIMPSLKPEPEYVRPQKPYIPEWNPPPPPDPVGYLAGQKPIFLVDCSATMAGERMSCAQDVIRHLFSTGGQVEVAATHFDIIMYSFDAWSFGALEEERQHKLSGGAPRYWIKNLEFMQPKTLENMDKALSWMLRWQTGGTSNLKKAIEFAMQRTSADCIYLLTHGKCDRPVIIMNTLKEFEKERRLIPIYPIGIEPTKPQARILKNILADITYGQYRELDLKWQYNLYIKNREASEDIKWLNTGVEYWQRKCLEVGAPERIENILERLKNQFDLEKRAPLLAIYQIEEGKAKLQHQIMLDAIQEENNQVLGASQESYERTHFLIMERNKQAMENARKLWESKVENIRAINQQNNKLYGEWQTKVLEIEATNKKTEKDARRQFVEDIKSIEERYTHKLFHGKEDHDIVVRRLKERNELLTTNYEKKQNNIILATKEMNMASWKAYEDKCAKIKLLNKQNLENAQAEYLIACETIVKKNQEKINKADANHKWRFESIVNENARRKSEYIARVQDLEEKKIQARNSHQLRVSTLVAEHKANIANIVVTNNILDKEAKVAWEDICKVIDEENRLIIEMTYQKWKEAAHVVQLENEHLATRRLELQLKKEEVEHMNLELVKEKKAKWKETCHQMEVEYGRQIASARLEHEQYVKEVQIHNEQLLEMAKKSHDAKVDAIKKYNETIRPYVEESKSLQKEINKIQAFLGYIVNQSDLPPEMKVNKKRTLEQSLNMLVALDSPCPPKMIVSALQAAYAKDIKDKMFSHKTQDKVDRFELDDIAPIWKTKEHGRFSNMVSIEPSRAVKHCCIGGTKVDDEESRCYYSKLQNDVTKNKTQQENLMTNIMLQSASQ